MKTPFPDDCVPHASMVANRHSLDKRVSELSAALASTSPDQLDSVIEDAMRGVRKLVGASRICWYIGRGPNPNLERIYSAIGPGVPAAPPIIRPADVPRTFAQLAAGDSVVLRFPDDLPQRADFDERFFKDNSIGSVILIPSNCGNEEHGVLGIAFSSSDLCWTDKLLMQLGMLSNLIATHYERKVAYELGQESERRFQCLFREAPIGIALEDSRGGLLFVNPTLCAVLGYSERELQGRHCAELSDPEDEVKESILFQQLLAGTSDSYTIEKRFFRKDGRRIWGRVHVSLMKNRFGGPVLIIGMLEDITEQKRAEGELHRAQIELQQLTQRLIQVQDEERRRISRELHDDIGQRMSLFSVGLEQLSQSISSGERGKSLLVKLQEQAMEITSDVHQLSHKLYSSKLQHLGLRAALQELCKNLSAQVSIVSDVAVDNHHFNLSAAQELCLFRVAQEGLYNAVRHSQSKEIGLHLRCVDNVLQLRVIDDGIGFDLSSSFAGIGLASMRERLRMIGGALVVKSIPGKGTEIIAEIGLSSE